MEYINTSIVVLGHTGSRIQEVVSKLCEKPGLSRIPIWRNESLTAISSIDVNNAISQKTVPVVQVSSPESFARFKKWAETQGINTYSVMVETPRELAFCQVLKEFNGHIPEPLEAIDIPQELFAQKYESSEFAATDQLPDRSKSKTPTHYYLERMREALREEPTWVMQVNTDLTVEYDGLDLDNVTSTLSSAFDEFADELGLVEEVELEQEYSNSPTKPHNKPEPSGP